MGKYRTRELTQRVRYALLAGVAGAFLIPQVAAAAPTGEHDYTGVSLSDVPRQRRGRGRIPILRQLPRIT